MVSNRSYQTMASSLKWRLGFGWRSVSFFVAVAVIALAASGIVRWMVIAVAVLAFAFLIVQYQIGTRKDGDRCHAAMHHNRRGGNLQR